jgi:hypothetical protein
MFQQAFSAMRQRHKEQLAQAHGDEELTDEVHKPKDPLKPVHPVTRTCLLFFSEFRFIVLTTLVVLAALWLQRSIEETLNLFVNSRHPCKRILWMFLCAFLLILVAILVGVLWKPISIPPAKERANLETNKKQ